MTRSSVPSSASRIPSAASTPAIAMCRELIDAVKRGVMLAGGLPVEFPTITLHESFAYPTSMYPAQPDGDGHRGDDPRATGRRGGADRRLRQDGAGVVDGRGERERAGDHARDRPDAHRRSSRASGSARAPTAGASGRAFARAKSTQQEINEVNAKLAPTAGTCMVMGTASTMALCTEAMGMMLPGGARIPAVMAERIRNAEATGARAVAIAKEKLTPAKIMTPAGVRERAARAARDRRLDQRDRPSRGDGGAARHRASISMRSTASGARRRCWSISSRPASTIWKTSTRRAA